MKSSSVLSSHPCLKLNLATLHSHTGVPAPSILEVKFQGLTIKGINRTTPAKLETLISVIRVRMETLAGFSPIKPPDPDRESLPVKVVAH